MSNEIKKEFKFFLLPDYEKEEAYLTEMHQNGWKLKQINSSGFVYTFEKCKPENVVYRLDFAENKEKDMQSYIAMFGDYGWEYIQDINHFSYFRKNADGLSGEDTELFSDTESRLDMMQRIINTKLMPVWLIFVLILIPDFMMLISHDFDVIPMQIVLTVLFGVLFAMYSYILIHCQVEFSRLKKKYTKE